MTDLSEKFRVKIIELVASRLNDEAYGTFLQQVEGAFSEVETEIITIKWRDDECFCVEDSENEDAIGRKFYYRLGDDFWVTKKHHVFGTGGNEWYTIIRFL